MHFSYFIAHSTHDQLKTTLALSTSTISCNMSCASLNKFDSTDKAQDPELSFIADCVNVCLDIALHCLALTALPWTYCIALHLLHYRQAHVMQTLHCFASNFADKHMSCILYDVTVHGFAGDTAQAGMP